MRIAVIIPSLAGGGKERMRLHLIKEWLDHGIAIDLVLCRKQGDLLQLVPSEVKIYEVAAQHNYFFPFGFLRYLIKHRPTHILSASNDITAMSLLINLVTRLDIPVVASFHNHLSSEVQFAKGLKFFSVKIVNFILAKTISRAKGVIAVSKSVADDLIGHFPCLKDNIYTINNPTINQDMRRRATQPLSGNPVPAGIPWIFYAGRLVPAKGLDVLLQAFYKIAARSNAHLVLAGEGPLRAQLTDMVRDMKLIDRVHFMGFQENPLPWMREADVFVLPSRHEGLPNVLIEALACGAQIVATDCPGGSEEILGNGIYGQLVPVDDAVALSNAVIMSLNREFYVAPEILKDRAEDYTVEKAANEYLNVLKNA
ncbi:glycosyltransferase [Desulfonatronovibrio magnus]|uniref:glycosyltransferase n=1 Tax=Desulfonatronovibrio magnus TaxID=698827 RepID=UPI0005EBC6A7|nr:glycosyltransferase [Desulfonatronovibrio magnus]